MTAFWCGAAFPFTTAFGKAAFWVVLCLGLTNYAAYRGSDKQDWRKSAEYVIANARVEDAVYVLGADPGRSARDYLEHRDVDGFFYCRNLPFYRFYFRRLQAPGLAGELRHLAVDGATALIELRASPAATIFVLSPHHLVLSEETLAALSAQFTTEELALRSTIVYRFQKKQGPGGLEGR